MSRGRCMRHGQEHPCSCAMGNLYRFIEPLVLYVLKTKGRSYGYELHAVIEEHALTDSAIERGALYRTLRRLEENKYVQSTWDIAQTGPARRLYELTEAGEEHLQEWAVVLDQLSMATRRFVGQIREAFDETDGPSQKQS